MGGTIGILNLNALDISVILKGSNLSKPSREGVYLPLLTYLWQVRFKTYQVPILSDRSQNYMQKYQGFEVFMNADFWYIYVEFLDFNFLMKRMYKMYICPLAVKYIAHVWVSRNNIYSEY